MKKVNKVIFAVGGSGGHIVPALAARRMFFEEGAETLLLGKGLLNHPNMNEGVLFKEIASGRPISTNLWRVFRETQNLVAGYRMACQELSTFRPDAVIGFGSYHSLPVLMAAVKQRVPLFLHEQNVLPGKVNQLFSRFAKGVGVSFSSAIEKLKCPGEEVFLPKRAVIEGQNLSSEQKKYTVICVVGGSQGAAVLNDIVPPVLADVMHNCPTLYVHHIVGPRGNAEAVARFYASAQVPCCVKSFEDNMLKVLSSADLVITRAGATILDEILWCCVPAIFIPYPGAYRHQEENAKFVAYVIGGGAMILQKQLTHESLKRQIIVALDGDTMKNQRDSLQKFRDRNTSPKSLYQFVCERL